MFEDCGKCLHYELKAKNVRLYHENPTDFVKSQWPIRQPVYIAYRVVVALGFWAWLVLDVLPEPTWTYLVYATNWGFLLLAISALVTATTTVYYSVNAGMVLDRHSFESMPTSLKLQWLLQNTSYNSAIVVTVAYWTYVALLGKNTDIPIIQTTMSELKHTLTTACVLVDVMVSGTPFRVLHLPYTVVLGFVYSIFNAIYFLSDGTMTQGRHYAYNLLDWSQPEEAVVTCVLGAVICILSQIILYKVYKFRMWLYTRIYFGSSYEKPGAELSGFVGTVSAAEYMAIMEDPDANPQSEAAESLN